jgi:hypothetical protein
VHRSKDRVDQGGFARACKSEHSNDSTPFAADLHLVRRSERGRDRRLRMGSRAGCGCCRHVELVCKMKLLSSEELVFMLSSNWNCPTLLAPLQMDKIEELHPKMEGNILYGEKTCSFLFFSSFVLFCSVWKVIQFYFYFCAHKPLVR